MINLIPKPCRSLILILLVSSFHPISNARNLEKLFASDVSESIANYVERPDISEAALQHLPPPVVEYLRYTGVVDNNRWHNVRAIFSGEIRTSREAEWLDVTTEQYNFFHQPARLFFMRAKKRGFNIIGYHRYKGINAFREVKVASLFKVVDKSGDKIFRSETVAFFYDLCLLAPANLVSKRIQWKQKNPGTVEASFTNKGVTIKAELHFNEEGQLVKFVSDDRYYSKEDAIIRQYRWSSEIEDYREWNGIKLPSSAAAYWHLPEGKYQYARFRLREFEYNKQG